MGKRTIERKLRQTSARLRELRDELVVIDAQLAHLSDEADDLAIRALVSETSGAGTEHRHAQAHAEAMSGHRERVVTLIADLERRQDELLDALSAS